MRSLPRNILEYMAQCPFALSELLLHFSTFASPAPEFQPKHHKMRRTQVASCIKPELSDIVNVLALEDPGQTEREFNYLDQLPHF